MASLWDTPLIGEDGTMDPRMGGLLAFGASLMKNGRSGQRLGEQLGGGLLDSMQAQNFLAQQSAQQKRWAAQEALQRQELDEHQQDRQAAQQQQQRMQNLIGTLPPEQQQIAMLNPDAFAKSKADQMFAAPKPPTTRNVIQGSNEVTQEFDPATGGWKEIGQGARWAPQQPGQGPESYSVLSPDEVKRMGLPEGSVVQRSSRGKIDVLGGAGAAGAETWRLMAPDELMKNNFAPGTVASVSSRGQVQVEQNPKAPGMTVYGPDGQPIVTTGSGDPMVNRDATKIDRAADLNFKTADDALTGLENRLKDTGVAVLPGAEQQKTGSQYRLVINELRKLTDSGALQKADLDYLQSIIQDPTSLSAAPTALGNVIGTGSPVTGTLDQIQTVRDYLTNVRKRTGEVYQQPKAPAPPAAQDATRQSNIYDEAAAKAQPVQIKGDEDYAALPSGSHFIGPDGKTRVKP
jgi:hypothetical protein